MRESIAREGTTERARPTWGSTHEESVLTQSDSRRLLLGKRCRDSKRCGRCQLPTRRGRRPDERGRSPTAARSL
jgi:hypothetical protein